MQKITCWDDLRPYGIDMLTGEACGLSYRLLCDVTEKGKHTIQIALGIANLDLHDSWNRGDSNDPHIGSLMVVPELLVPLSVFALLESGCREVYRTKSDGLLGIEPADDPQRVDAVKRFHAENGNFVRRYAYAGTAGDRNRHEMSGRIV